ncbi:TetR/AcrR family transcriptional regulator [Pararhodonellum marinum]|uniref:TetR/AcrR family transcriptional regulator n=1 Tax=Pararhodonellum marinum TaxID=2755358 RepID=UPI00188DCF6E|nr:TetR/AcrR family transcriptional regulator [Pararhodonellum marinum]
MGITEKKELKEKLILESAIKLFTEKGFHATKMEEVSKGAKISKGLTYFYFKNKEDLYMAVTKKGFEELKDVFRDILRSKGKSGLEMITALVNGYFDFTRTQRMYYDAILNFMGIMRLYVDENLRSQIDPLILESEHFQRLLEIHHDVAKIGVQLISHGIKDGSMRPDLQPTITFYTVWTMMIGFERLSGPVAYEKKEIKINSENWRLGFIRLLHDMLKGTIQAQRAQVVQGSLF